MWLAVGHARMVAEAHCLIWAWRYATAHTYEKCHADGNQTKPAHPSWCTACGSPHEPPSAEHFVSPSHLAPTAVLLVQHWVLKMHLVPHWTWPAGQPVWHGMSARQAGR